MANFLGKLFGVKSAGSRVEKIKEDSGNWWIPSPMQLEHIKPIKLSEKALIDQFLADMSKGPHEGGSLGSAFAINSFWKSAVDKSGISSIKVRNKELNNRDEIYRIFFKASFACSWELRKQLGLQEEGGLLDLDVSGPKFEENAALERALILLKESHSDALRFYYWLVQALANGEGLYTPGYPPQRYFDYIVKKAQKSVAGKVIQTGSDVIYVWRAVDITDTKSRHLCKVGITNMRTTEKRIRQVASDSGYDAEILVFTKVGSTKALRIVKELLKIGLPAEAVKGAFNGSTEFRYLTEQEIRMLPLTIAQLQANL